MRKSALAAALVLVVSTVTVLAINDAQALQSPVPLLLWGGSRYIQLHTYTALLHSCCIHVLWCVLTLSRVSGIARHTINSQRLNHLADVLQMIVPLLEGSHKPEVVVGFVSPQVLPSLHCTALRCTAL